MRVGAACIENPNEFVVKFDELTFTDWFEAGQFRFFDLNTPRVYETMHLPARTTNQLRVTRVLDSLIGAFEFRVRVSNGTVRFTSDAGSSLVTFRGTFPQRR